MYFLFNEEPVNKTVEFDFFFLFCEEPVNNTVEFNFNWSLVFRSWCLN